MAKAWTAPEGDVVPDPIETKIKILRAEQGRTDEIVRVLGSVIEKHLSFDAMHYLEMAGASIEEAIEILEEQRGTP